MSEDEALEGLLDFVEAGGDGQGAKGCGRLAREEIRCAMSKLQARIKELEGKLADRDEILSGIEYLIESGVGI